jgi:hypothetical protein
MNTFFNNVSQEVMLKTLDNELGHLEEITDILENIKIENLRK